MGRSPDGSRPKKLDFASLLAVAFVSLTVCLFCAYAPCLRTRPAMHVIAAQRLLDDVLYYAIFVQA